MKLAVIILNWNGIKLLEKFLHPLVRYSNNHAQIYMIDNKSTDGSVEYVSSNFPLVKIVNSIWYVFCDTNSVQGNIKKMQTTDWSGSIITSIKWDVLQKGFFFSLNLLFRKCAAFLTKLYTS